MPTVPLYGVSTSAPSASSKASSASVSPLRYLGGYPPTVQAEVARLLEAGRIEEVLMRRHGAAHRWRTDRALYSFACALRHESMRGAPALDKVGYDSKLQVVLHALGTHTSVARVQGHRLKAKHEIRIAALFKDAPESFLRMIVVHELAHLKVRDHNRSFYALCEHMEPRYHQLEFDVRLYLVHLAAHGERLWSGS